MLLAIMLYHVVLSFSLITVYYIDQFSHQITLAFLGSIPLVCDVCFCFLVLLSFTSAIMRDISPQFSLWGIFFGIRILLASQNQLECIFSYSFETICEGLVQDFFGRGRGICLLLVKSLSLLYIGLFKFSISPQVSLAVCVLLGICPF